MTQYLPLLQNLTVIQIWLLWGRTNFFDDIHGKICEDEPFDPTIFTSKEIPIVDVAIAYDFQFTHKHI